jgi:hypothetical protein
MTGWPFCPHQKWWTYFSDIWTHTLPPQSHCLVFHLCPLSSPCVCGNPGFPWGTHTLVSYNFLDLLPHLVCHAPWSPKSANVIFWEQPKEMGIAMVSRPLIWNFLHFWLQDTESFLEMLALVVHLWNCDWPGAPSKHPSLTLQSLLQVLHPFIKEVDFHLAACFW